MARLEDIRNGALVAGVVPNLSVHIVSNEWIGNQALNVIFRDTEGTVSETTLYREDEYRLSLEEGGRLWSFDADGGLLRLVTEANRIKLAHYFDPYLAMGQRHRQKPVGLNAQPGEQSSVGGRRQQHRHRHSFWVGLLQNSLEGIKQPHIRL